MTSVPSGTALRVLRVIVPHAKDGITFEEICGELLMSPDVVLHHLISLAQNGWIWMDEQAPEDTVRVRRTGRSLVEMR